MIGVYIELANPSRSYLAGQVVKGRVIVQNDSPLKFKEITVRIEGKGLVKWSQDEQFTVHVSTDEIGQSGNEFRTETHTVDYTASETYIHHKLCLFGDGHNVTVLDQGRTAFPFQFVLPSNIPSSFSSKFGLISYLLEAEIRTPIFTRNKRITLPFTVNGIVDLNHEFLAGQRQHLRKVKGSNFCACRDGKIGFVLKFPQRSGFVPGEILDFTCEVTNGSNQKVVGMKASLIQVTNYYARGHSKTERKGVVEMSGPEVDEGDHEMWIPNSMIIPPLPPSKLGPVARIIEVQYFLQFQMSIAGLSSKMIGEIPVLIGTIPLRTTFDQLRWQNPTQESTSSSQIIYLPDYPDLPPPIFIEASSSDKFTWNAGYISEDGNDSTTPRTSELPVPIITEYVPNYITYTSA